MLRLAGLSKPRIGYTANALSVAFVQTKLVYAYDVSFFINKLSVTVVAVMLCTPMDC
jgi:hypothetical protein